MNEDRRKKICASRNNDHLYVIACLETRRCKIGRSHQVWQRRDSLQACSPTALVLYAHAPGLGFLESVMHEAFAAERLHGEWFGSNAMQEIARCVRMDSPPSLAVFVERIRKAWSTHEEKRFAGFIDAGTPFRWQGKRRAA
jgi:hypothetical protein